MGRMVDLDDLVLSRHIVERLGWNSMVVLYHFTRTDPSFPAPVLTSNNGRTGGTNVYYWPDVREWARQRGKLPASLADDVGGTSAGPQE